MSIYFDDSFFYWVSQFLQIYRCCYFRNGFSFNFVINKSIANSKSFARLQNPCNGNKFICIGRFKKTHFEFYYKNFNVACKHSECCITTSAVCNACCYTCVKISVLRVKLSENSQGIFTCLKVAFKVFIKPCLSKLCLIFSYIIYLLFSKKQYVCSCIHRVVIRIVFIFFLVYIGCLECRSKIAISVCFCEQIM